MTIGQFEFYELLGKGAFGEVYRAFNKSTREIVSIKCITTPLSQQVPGWEKEIEIMKNFDHPNIVKCYGSFEDSGRIYIVMEYVDGDDLSTLLKNRKVQKKPISEKFILKVIFQISLALKYIHRHKVIHRDLKSSNILLTLDNDVKITDFGLSTNLKSTLSMASTIAGTLDYMSPELLSGQGHSFPTDIWSLGIMLYEIMTFDVPFKGALLQFTQLVDSGNIPQITQPYSSELKHLTSNMLKQEPLQRISASDILNSNLIQNIMP
jgi:serine/threonine protein kinase